MKRWLKLKERELVLLPRSKYEEFLGLQKILENRIAEERDTVQAVKIYKREKRQGKLKTIKSLAELR